MSPSIGFRSRECKNYFHARCYGLWTGLGFEARCSCNCHSGMKMKSDSLSAGDEIDYKREIIKQ